MLEIINNSNSDVGLYSGYDKNNQHQLTLVIKTSFHFDESGKLQPIIPPLKIQEIDEYINSGKSSLTAVNEIVPYKEKNEIIVYGTAYSTNKTSIITEVSLCLEWPNNNQWEKRLKIFGPRYWQQTLFGKIPSNPSLLHSLPIIYENSLKTNTNPVGCDLPQIEQGPRFIIKPTDKLPAAGFGPIPPAWRGFDTYNFAPNDQQFSQPFSELETITIKGMSTTKKITINLPKIKQDIILDLNQKVQKLEPVCDNIIIDCNKQTLCLIQRAGISWHINDQRQGAILITH